jgi:hypothetical protein
MDNVTQSDVFDLLNRLPPAKLPLAHSMLESLMNDDTGLLPAQSQFVRLPPAERRRVLAEQAQKMVAHYEQTTAERESWQSGEFCDD